ncbi:hypothetical protein EVG20_g5595 [Dentipellis fragilis]|uniref:F-box domain-containing protein n=1 Tax=Dentipellis fragilis TaxID=205917 RepID=A0A4Y9YSR1_9AGAM|nr:hypothetical protein EVG20_g5595 [Dentipellis fragilis]
MAYHTTWCILPSELFRNTPRLQCLQLHRCGLPWGEALSLANITHFDLSIVMPHLMPTADELFDVLASMPKLQTLILDDSPPTAPASKKLVFPRLKFLALHGEAQACADVLDCLEVPPDVDLRLEVMQIDYPFDLVLSEIRLIDMIQKYCGERRSSSRSSLKNCTTSPLIILPATASASASVPIFIVFDPILIFQNKKIAHSTTSTSTGLQNPNIRNLRVGGRFNFSEQHWLATFGRMQRITSVELEGNVAYDFLDAFNASRHSGSSLVPALFPAIQDLTIIRAELGRTDENGNQKFVDILASGISLHQSAELAGERIQLSIRNC